jgi:hypothetical protein
VWDALRAALSSMFPTLNFSAPKQNLRLPTCHKCKQLGVLSDLSQFEKKGEMKKNEMLYL